MPPSMSNAIGIIEALLAAEQGVKNITVGYGQCGNLVQDVSCCKGSRRADRRVPRALWLQRYGNYYRFHQWMGGFPKDEAKAFGVISLGSIAAGLAGATKVIVKTPHEAVGIPTKEANAAGIRATKMALSMLGGQRMPDAKAIADEKAIIKAETKCILDKVLELGMGDLAIGTVKAFEQGVIDVPFAPSRYNAGKILPARDNVGCKHLMTGNIPFSKTYLTSTDKD